MSKFDCVRCGNDAEGGDVWLGEGGSYICHPCARGLIDMLGKFIGEPLSADEYGPTVEFHQIVKFFSTFDHDVLRRTWVKTCEIPELDLYNAGVRL